MRLFGVAQEMSDQERHGLRMFLALQNASSLMSMGELVMTAATHPCLTFLQHLSNMNTGTDPDRSTYGNRAQAYQLIELFC